MAADSSRFGANSHESTTPFHFIFAIRLLNNVRSLSLVSIRSKSTVRTVPNRRHTRHRSSSDTSLTFAVTRRTVIMFQGQIPPSAPGTVTRSTDSLLNSIRTSLSAIADHRSSCIKPFRFRLNCHHCPICDLCLTSRRTFSTRTNRIQEERPTLIHSTECRLTALSSVNNSSHRHRLKDKVTTVTEEPALRADSPDSSMAKNRPSFLATSRTRSATCRIWRRKTIGPDSPTRAFVKRSFAKSTRFCRFNCSSRSARSPCSCSSECSPVNCSSDIRTGLVSLTKTSLSVARHQTIRLQCERRLGRRLPKRRFRFRQTDLRS
jgi:hypothetical protein